MDSIKPANSSHLGGKLRGLTKVLRFRTGGIAPDENIRKAKFQDKVEENHLYLIEEERIQKRIAVEALLAKVFASLSSVKAGYAQLQIAQSPYDAEGIQLADDIVVNELKRLSELKQSYLKKQIDPSPEETQLLAEREEQKNLLKTYEIIGKKIESQLKLKDSEIEFLREKAEECNKENRALEKRLSQNGTLSFFDDLHLSRLNPNHFNIVLKHAVKSVRSFVKLMINGMESSGWDIDAAASSIDANVVFTKTKHKCFAFESFVCREMFDGFQHPGFSFEKDPLPAGKQRQQHFFDQFMKLKSLKPKALFSRNSPSTSFGKFCRAKYLYLVHPKMELSLFGDLNQRNLVNSRGYPETSFFDAFSEMARRIWLLHCLAFSFEPEASIFQVQKGSRFSEVYMESVTEDVFLSTGNPQVCLTVVPGFKISKNAIIQAQVYLSTS
ncbi:Gravitropic in the light [Thalictrum thalictroides]|uniref:Gravitropic in the light n=1 Tax=Thalictrum thalictroides TaxID=46969 RepID=A0A7J6V6L9_THATH|nr:Gravitropic in the light [Thalictrum thalictroides]